MDKQRTIAKPVTLSGIGIHSGNNVQVTIRPAPENTGRILIYKQGNKEIYIPCSSEYVLDTRNQVTLGTLANPVKTVEHLLSALNAFHITNCFIETSSQEIPIMDGSSFPFVEAIKKAGIKIQQEEAPMLSVPHPIWITEEDRYIIILPDDKQRIHFHIHFDHKLIGHQECYFEMDESLYEEEISRSRTFGFYRDWQQLKSLGLGLGCSFENTLVYGDKNLLNELRYDNEPVRHKVLDLYGDFSLLGMPIHGYIIANKSGHQLNVKLIKRIKDEILGNSFTNKEIKKANQQFERFLSQNAAIKNIAI